MSVIFCMSVAIQFAFGLEWYWRSMLNGLCVLQLKPQGLCQWYSLRFLFEFQMEVYASGLLWICHFQLSTSRSMLAILDGTYTTYIRITQRNKFETWTKLITRQFIFISGAQNTTDQMQPQGKTNIDPERFYNHVCVLVGAVVPCAPWNWMNTHTSIDLEIALGHMLAGNEPLI